MTDEDGLKGLDAAELERQVWLYGGSKGLDLLVETALARRYNVTMKKSYATLAKLQEMIGIPRREIEKSLETLVRSGRWRKIDSGSYAPVRTKNYGIRLELPLL